MNEQTDSQLLCAYAEQRSEPAFRELVRRHLDLVHSAALRMVCDPHLAQDVAQGVFLALAKNAAQLADRPVLSGWLHRTAQNIAAQTVRTDVRRRRREEEAAAMNELLSDSASVTGVPPDWSDIAPHLDAALGDLNETDRDAVLLRYFEKKSAAEIALRLGITAEAAQKRVSRAVERLREFFAKRGVTVGTGGLVVVISANAVQTAPAGLAVTISAAALAGTTVTTSTLIAATTKTIAMTTLQKTLVTATVAVLAGAGIYEARQAAQLRNQVQTLQQQAPLSNQIQQLQHERDDASNRLANLLADNARLRTNSSQAELLQLRGQISRLKMEAEQTNDPVVKKALRWKANVEKMNLLFAEHPEQQVPEMKLLSDEYFFDVARDQDLETTNGIRKAFNDIRTRAKNNFMPMLQEALLKFIESNPGKGLKSISDLQPYFNPLNPPVDESMLQQYRPLTKEERTEMPGMTDYMIIGLPGVDAELDRAWHVGPTSYGQNAAPDGMMDSVKVILPAINAYRAANNNQMPTDLLQIRSYLTTPDQEAAYEKVLKNSARYGKLK